MRCSWVVFTGLAVVAGCEGAAPSFEEREAIVAGMPDTGDPAIMEMISFRGNLGARCTATLVTPKILVLAAHCFVETPGFNTRVIFAGTDDSVMKSATDGLAIETFVYDPAYNGMPRQGHDFAIVVLKAPLSVPPIRINRERIDDARGKMVRYVGYGQAVVGNPQSGGIKRQNTAPLATVSQLLLSVAQNAHGTCEGDSGGPLLFDDGKGEALVGVASFVTNPACLRDSFYQRVDTQLAWLDAQIAKYDPGGPAPPDAGALADAAPTATPDGAPASTPDAQTPDTAPPKMEPPFDARPRDTAAPPTEDPEPEPTKHTASGGCSAAGGAGGGLWLLVLALVRRAGGARLPP